MSQTQPVDSRTEGVEAAALALPRADRAALAARLLDSLDEGAESSTAWEAELGRRVDALRSGRSKTRPVEEFLAELEEQRR
jgi:putative addiction module component (TIGR02574 family)